MSSEVGWLRNFDEFCIDALEAYGKYRHQLWMHEEPPHGQYTSVTIFDWSQILENEIFAGFTNFW